MDQITLDALCHKGPCLNQGDVYDLYIKSLLIMFFFRQAQKGNCFPYIFHAMTVYISARVSSRGGSNSLTLNIEQRTACSIIFGTILRPDDIFVYLTLG